MVRYNELQWRTLIPSSDRRYTVKGHELNQAVCGQNSRFALIEVRSLDKDRHLDLVYRVRDAHTVSDDDIKAGKRPQVVFENYDIDAAINFINGVDTV
jgi:hypothetical protein